MEEEEPSTVAATVDAAAAAASGGLKMGKYVHETIKNIETAVFDDEDEDDHDHDFMLMVDDPLEVTVVVITITINRYMSSQSSSSSSPAAPETVLPEEDTTTKRSYVLEGFLKDNSPDELDELLRDKTVTARTLERIKETILRRRYKIKKIALELRRKQIVIHMKLDLLMWYSDDDQEDLGAGETVDDDDDDDYDSDEEMFETEEETFNDEYDDGMNWKPALRYSVEALETRTFENEEDLEMMLKSTTSCRSCGICLDEFSIDVAAGKISIKTMPCSHFFHSECIVPWLEKRHTCPICQMPTW